MSLILDALNKSRQDAGKIPGLATVHYEDAPVAARKWRQALPWSALALALLVVAWLLVERNGQDVTAALPSPEVAARSQPAGAPQAPAQPPARAMPVEQTVPPTIAPPVAPVVEERAVEAAKPAPAADVPQHPDVADLYRQQQAEPSAEPRAAQPESKPARPDPAVPVRQEEPVDIEKLVARAEEELKDARLEEHEAPFVAALSQQTKDGIPSLWYTNHDYSGDPARSSVILNGKTLRAGGSVAGVKVEEVLADSVVLNFQGTRFRLRALNSWVNL